MSPQDWHGHLLVSVPAFLKCRLSPCPTSPICSSMVPGVPAQHGTPLESPPCSKRLWGCASPLLHDRSSPSLSTSHRPFVPIAGHSPMTFSICRLTTGIPTSTCAPFPIQPLPPQMPFPSCPWRDLAQCRGSGCPWGPKLIPWLVCRSLTSCAVERDKVQAAQGSRYGRCHCTHSAFQGDGTALLPW